MNANHNNVVNSTKTSRRRRGFTLIEATIALLLTSLLFLGSMEMFVTMCRTTTKNSAEVNSSATAAIGLQRIVEMTNESTRVTLSTESGFEVPGGTDFQSSQFRTSAGVCTGLQVTTTTAQSASGAPIVFIKSNGQSATVIPHGSSFGANGMDESLWIYRANNNGTPNANSGTTLWAKGKYQGQAMSRPLVKNLDASSLVALKFSKPEPNQMGVTIRSSDYSAIGEQGVSKNSVVQTASTAVLLRNAN